MNKLIKIGVLSLNPKIKKSIKNIIDQLEENNYALVYDPNVARVFSRCVKKDRDIRIYIFQKKGSKNITNVTNAIIIKPNLKIVRKDAYSFRLKVK